jgi:hypothetical protein
LPLFGLLVLMCKNTLWGWPWPLRLVLHAGWMIISAGVLVVCLLS